ncbi:MAG: NADP-dependent oxidoreductase [Micrococcales bacterium]|nr:NADP-dependent oxidoreductase [Micrococcales bacterium]
MTRAVRFPRFGGPEVLEVVDLPEPHAGAGQVRVRVHAAGLNPTDWKSLSGSVGHYAVQLPSGNGNDFAGVVDEVGVGVAGLAAGDRVFGGWRFHAQADHLVLAPERLVPVPDGLDLIVAATLDIVGRTALAALAEVRVVAGETVLVSGASGGLGQLVTQLAVQAGAHVLGTGSEASRERIQALGAEWIPYGPGLAERLREASRPGPDGRAGIDAVLDCAGHGTVAAAIEAGVAPARINTNADPAAIARFGIRNAGGHTAPSPEPLRDLAERIAAGGIDIRVAAQYPLERVRDAYTELMRDHPGGKIVLRLF